MTDKQQQALDKKAENARELGLDYEPVLVQQPATLDEMHDIGNGIMYGEPEPVQEPVAEVREDMKGGGYVHWLSEDYFVSGTKLYTSPPAQRKPCEWQREDDDHMPDTWRSACGVLWTFTDGGPVDNDMKYCCGCGAKLKEKSGG
jgi:hypothetical protein